MKKIETNSAGYYTGGGLCAQPPIVRAKRSTLTPLLIHLLNEIRKELEPLLEENQPSEADLILLIEIHSKRLGFELTLVERDELLSQLIAEQRPFGILQALVDQPEISDIMVYSFSKISSKCADLTFKTDLSFTSQEAYEVYVEKLLQKAATTYSTKKPIADGMIGSFARVHAVHKAICEAGPYLSLRLNRFNSVSIIDLFGAGLAPLPIFDYLKSLVLNGQTILVVGEVGSGKTTLVRALGANIPQTQSILVIEDTPEIRLDHPQVRYIVTRQENSEGVGRISPSECIRAGMRMAMNRIIFGEIRDAEAAEAFIDVCASGHPGLSTLHSKSENEAITRLELFLGRAQRGTARQVIIEQIATAVQVIVFVKVCAQSGKRRIFAIKEIGPVAEGMLRQREIFRYQFCAGIPAWRVLHKLSAHQKQLEAEGLKVHLSKYPDLLELNGDNSKLELLGEPDYWV